MNEKLKLSKYYWVVLATNDLENDLFSIEVVGIYKYKKYAEKILESLPLAVLRRVPVIVD